MGQVLTERLLLGVVAALVCVFCLHVSLPLTGPRA